MKITIQEAVGMIEIPDWITGNKWYLKDESDDMFLFYIIGYSDWKYIYGHDSSSEEV